MQFKTNTLFESYKLQVEAMRGLDRSCKASLSHLVFLEAYRTFEAIINSIIRELCLLPKFSQKFLKYILGDSNHINSGGYRKLMKQLLGTSFSKNDLVLEKGELISQVLLLLNLNLYNKIEVCVKSFDLKKIDKHQKKELETYILLRNYLIHQSDLEIGPLSEANLDKALNFFSTLVEHFETEFNKLRDEFFEEFIVSHLCYIIRFGFERPSFFSAFLGEVISKNQSS